MPISPQKARERARKGAIGRNSPDSYIRSLEHAELTAEQARSSSLTKLRSFNQRVQVASVAVQTEMTLIGKALDSPSP